MSTLAALADGLEQGPAKVRQVIQGLTAEQVRARPVPGKWSILEVIGHLADSDQIWAHRIKRVIAEELPLLIGYDETKFAASLGYHQLDLNEVLDLSERTRRQLAQIIRNLKPEALLREGIHSERGKVNLREMLEIEIEHFEHHLRFLLEKRQALGVSS
ncbi:DinB family protein [soil metagenome]